MERTSAELKRLAREKLAGHWGNIAAGPDRGGHFAAF